MNIFGLQKEGFRSFIHIKIKCSLLYNPLPRHLPPPIPIAHSPPLPLLVPAPLPTCPTPSQVNLGSIKLELAWLGQFPVRFSGKPDSPFFDSVFHRVSQQRCQWSRLHTSQSLEATPSSTTNSPLPTSLSPTPSTRGVTQFRVGTNENDVGGQVYPRGPPKFQQGRVIVEREMWTPLQRFNKRQSK